MSEFRQFPAWESATLDQLREERDHWLARLNEATGWGASVGAAHGFLEACEVWIRKREREAASAGRSGEAGETPLGGSTEGESAVPEGNAPKTSQDNP